MQDSDPLLTVPHPAPRRGTISTALLFLGLFAGPVVWGLQLVINFALASHACFPDGAPLAAPAWHSAWGVILLLNLFAAVVALAGAALSYQHWQATRMEHHGDASHAIEAGEGRTRFLALWGVMTGLGFLAAILFNTIALFMVPQCAG
ncbi:hypothetical protein [uncultured Methylovirgula sp.]|uniref:hypothetical protein n=1 Tax=uncultured Methylovirgula sp. TaxID=1285960 RepID=UPI002638B60D|nr:hypothetical protein [uncultured Methylovirgula sp.]